MEKVENSEIKICSKSEIPSGHAKSFHIGDKEIGVFNINEKFYAIDNMCIHAGAPLCDGSIDEKNCQVTCGWHAWTFDLATGKCISHPRQDVFASSYLVKVKGEELFLSLN